LPVHILISLAPKATERRKIPIALVIIRSYESAMTVTGIHTITVVS
jgi:hypothetical protein